VSVSRATPTIVAPTAYPLAGSFVDFLLRARRERDAGVPAFEHTRGFGTVIESRFAAAFGWPVAAAEAEWRAFLVTV